MKIRWTKNSVRVRITPEELDALRRGESTGEILYLAGKEGWSTRITPDATQTTIELVGTALELTLSQHDISRLAQPDTEGVYFETGEEPAFRYFVEKDFPCAHPRPSEAQETPTETFCPPDSYHVRKSRAT